MSAIGSCTDLPAAARWGWNSDRPLTSKVILLPAHHRQAEPLRQKVETSGGPDGFARSDERAPESASQIRQPMSLFCQSDPIPPSIKWEKAANRPRLPSATQMLNCELTRP